MSRRRKSQSADRQGRRPNSRNAPSSNPHPTISGEGGTEKPNPFSSAAKWVTATVLGALIVGLVGLLLSPTYAPRIRNYFDSDRSPVDINAEPQAPGASAANPSVSASGGTRTTPTPNKRSNDSGQKVPAPERRTYQVGLGQWALPSKLQERQAASITAAAVDSDGGVDPDKLGRWIRENGGADIDETIVRLTLQGIDQNVALTGLRAEIINRTPTMNGAYIPGDGSGGVNDPIKIALDLDQNRPTAAFFNDKAVTIAAGETVILDITAKVTSSTVTWDIALDFVVAGKKRTVIAKANSAHFRTTNWFGPPERRDDEGYEASSAYQSAGDWKPGPKGLYLAVAPPGHRDG